MNSPKNVFTIRDLENLSGIKAHTIRIWEKRYSVLEPMRTDTNIRFYDVNSLQKLLNIATLHTFGYKISTISKLAPEKIPVLVREILSNKSLASHVLNNFKLAMMNFDQQLFLHTYNSLLQEKSFRDIFYDFFIPLLNNVGFLWQTNTITPAHEHFLSCLIKQKLSANIEKLQLAPPTKTDRTFVLFLPENEIHDISLMFINYELSLNGNRVVYLGENTSVTSLADMKNYFDNITFITNITTEPAMDNVNPYIDILKANILNDTTSMLYVMGHNSQFIKEENLSGSIRAFDSINSLTDTIY